MKKRYFIILRIQIKYIKLIKCVKFIVKIYFITTCLFDVGLKNKITLCQFFSSI